MIKGDINTDGDYAYDFGIDKQCVEFARRWLYLNSGMVFDEVTTASDIWECIHYYRQVSDGKKLPVSSIPNVSALIPKIGDLIIYDKKYLMTGHVSVVVKVDPDACQVIVHEQNHGNLYRYPHQERLITLIQKKGKYHLLDEYLIGWKSLADIT